MSQDAYAEMSTVLRDRVANYWNEWEENDWEYVSSRFGATYEFDDSQEGAFTIWRREGFDPTLLLPRPQILDPDERDTLWRSCVAFDDHSTSHWFSNSTAIFFVYAKWGGLDDLGCQLFPSLGETEQAASGLMGAVKLELTAPSDSQVRRFRIISTGRGQPIWDEMADMRDNQPASPDAIPGRYVDDFHVPQTEWLTRQECLGALLPDDLRSPFALDLISHISYCLGWFALVHGLRTLIDGWQGVNEVLAKTPLQGFQDPQ